MDVGSPSLVMWLKLAMLIVGEGALLVVLARRVGRDWRLTSLVLGSYGLRVCVTFAMFYISLRGWPILQQQQYSQGFWLFGVDATTYHLYGATFANAWAKGFELSDPQLNLTYFFVVGLIYWLLGPHPLYPALVNCLLASLVAVLAYAIGRRLFNRVAGLVGAALIGFWPSSLLWSSQVLKDSLAWALCFSTLFLILTLLPQRHVGSHHSRMGTLARCGLLACTISVLSLMRPYMGSLFSVAIGVVLVPLALVGVAQHRVRDGLRCFTIALVIVACSLAARTWDLFRWFSPPHPDIAHFRWAVRYAKAGELDRASGEFSRAVQLNDAYTDAYRGLAVMTTQLGNREASNGLARNAIHSYRDAIRMYGLLLEREHDMRQRQLIQQVMGRLYFEVAACLSIRKSADDASEAFKQACALYPDIASEYEALRLRINGASGVESAALPPPKHVEPHPAKRQGGTLTPTPHVPAPARAGAGPGERHPAYANDLSPSRLWREAHGGVDPPEALRPAGPDNPSSDHGRSEAAGAAGQLTSLSQRLAALDSLAVEFFPQAARKSLRTEPLDYLQQHGLERAVWQLPIAEERSQQLATRSTRRADGLMESVTRLDEEALLAASEMSTESLDSRRQGFIDSGGYSLMDAWVTISNPKALVRYLPRALLIGFLAPFPPQWFDTKGSTGIMRTLASADMLLIYLLIPALLIGIWDVVRRRRADGILLLVFVFVVAVPMSLVVANLGSLYRLRLQFVLPMLVLAGGGLVGVRQSLGFLRTKPRSTEPVAAVAAALAEPVATSSVVVADAQRQATCS